MIQCNSNYYLKNNNESLLLTQPTEFSQFNAGDTDFMDSNEFFMLQQEPENNSVPSTSTSSISMSGMKDKHWKKITPPALTCLNTKMFPCDLCNSTFHFNSELKKHKRLQHHILPKIYKCPKCDDSFNFENNYKIHLYSHLKTTKQCPECLQNFKRTTIFLKHLKLHQNNDCFQCSKCGVEFEFKEYYDWHLNDNNLNRNCNILTRIVRKKESIDCEKKTISKKHVCQICGKKFQKPFFLKRHENIHFNIKPFECEECSAKFTQKNSLERHKLVHTKEKPYECPKCNMRFSQRPNLVLHDQNVHSHSSNDPAKYPCPNCSCVFNKTNSLNRHISERHKLSLNDQDSVKNVMDQLKDFLIQQNCQKENINNAVEVQENSKTLQLKLPENNPINNAENLKTTESATIKGDNNIITNFVKVIDTLNQNKEIKYKIVQQIIQNGNKWFSCNVCEKKFKLSYDLLRHLTVHTKERAFICPICTKAFSLKNTLKCHLKVHSREKRFYCTICFLKFPTLKQLNDHISVHGKLKLFLCQICGKSFRTSHNLSVHQQVHRRKDKRIENIEKTLIAPIKIQIDNSDKKILKNCDEKYQCLICGVLLKTMSHLRFHEKQHLNLKTFECSICYKRFSTKSSLNVHRKIHFAIRSMKCELCPSKFRSSTDLKRHKVAHSTERKFLCPYCDKLFKTNSTCLAHIKLHAKEQLEIFNQNSHSNENEDNSNEEAHIVPDENQEYSLKMTKEKIDLNIPNNNVNLHNYCELLEKDLCLEKENDENLISSNLLFMNNFNISRETPTVNTDKTAKQNNLMEKQKFIDLEDIPKLSNNQLKSNFIVESMKKGAHSHDVINYDSNLPLFNIKINTKKNSFTCEYCEKIFKKPIDYRRHIRSHTKEKPFLCQLCNKSFSLKCTLNNHLKVHDKNRKTYNCIVCDKKYASKSVLNTHVRLHTGEMPYQCDFCLKEFRTLGHRNAHICQNNKNL